MSKPKTHRTHPVLHLRLSAELLERADALINVLSARYGAQHASGRVDRSVVLRLAIERGLKCLEEETDGPR